MIRPRVRSGVRLTPRRENRQLPVPPEGLRVAVGPFADAETFLQSGRETLALLTSLCELRPDHAVLDVGCGSGRVALPLTEYLSHSGSYVGFDPVAGLIQWCHTHITAQYPNFHFRHVDVHNASYHPEGRWPAAAIRFPCEPGSVDVALLSSVFTHLLPEDVAAYVRELRRVLRPGGRCLVSYLLMNDEARAAVEAETTIFDLQYRHGPYVSFSREHPTEGLAYDEVYALKTLREAGLAIETVRYGTWRHIHSFAVEHDWVVARKPISAA
ncbi:MAG TPA: class I SAM-dependent methyltransferase [Gemmatimonadaceae bacterium]|nr:class I SAM-dependent methyltransferase [Gemmatimonadaceae bacterium]